jgi:hypothetical protein
MERILDQFDQIIPSISHTIEGKKMVLYLDNISKSK